MRSASTAVVKHNPKHAKVNLMNAAQAEDSSDVIMGNLLINDIPAKVLFDSGASHSFMSRCLPSMIMILLKYYLPSMILILSSLRRHYVWCHPVLL